MEYKQVIVVRSDLNMGKGKTCAQVAHASLSSAEAAMRYEKDWYGAWKNEGQKKVVVKIQNEKVLFELYEMAKGQGLPPEPVHIIGDIGKFLF